METKKLPFEVKAEDDGTITGYGSVFGVKDQGDDIVVKGAFSASLGGNIMPKMLFQHDPDRVIGVWDEATEDEKGLRLKGRLALKTRLGAEVHELMKMGAFDGLSIGYRVTDEAREGGARMIKSAELWEVSAVTFPMNTEARIDAVKAAEMTPREIERILTQDAKFSRSFARSLMGGGLKSAQTMLDAGGLDEVAALFQARLS
jgi:HK97 family phage prohead protease